MITQRRFLVILILSAVTFTVPSTAEAGPLLDWLFHRNRSQGLAGSYTAARPAVAPPNAARPGCTSCLTNLFGRNRPGYANANRTNPNATANALAGNPNNTYGTTAGYAPQGGCSSGWCQQTVVRWIPQTAYRTEYQSVPVTTYKTSTSINPANGLPLTCTRPCTSYTRQARRVPYTAYRPIYTTVPVADTWGQQPQQQGAQALQPQLAQPQQPAFGRGPAGNNYPAAPPVPNYAYQPPSAPPASYTGAGGCTNCQNGGSAQASAGYGNWSNVPGYTPGDATNLPRAAAGAPWSNTPLSGTQNPAATNPRGATPWQDLRSRGGAAADPRATPWQTAQDPALRGQQGYGAQQGFGGSAGPTDWQTVGPNGVTGPPQSQGGQPADSAPSLLRPNTDEYSWSTSRPSAPVMPEYMRRRIIGGADSQLVPRQRAEAEPDNTNYDNPAPRDPYAASRGYQPSDNLFRVPLDKTYTNPPPALSAPSNQRDNTSSTERDAIRGIRDLHRTQGLQNYNDKTARQRAPASSKPLIQDTTHTRYAATPIQWAVPKKRPASQQAPSDWRNNAEQYRAGAGESQPRADSRLRSNWSPIR